MFTLSPRLPRLLPIAASLCIAFGITAHTHTASAATLLVTDCSDGAGSGTLRHTIGSAASGDTVLIQASLGCSKITVNTNAIAIGVADLTLQGPGAGALTISGGFDATPHQYHSIFYHNGTGTFTLQGVTLTESKYTGTAIPSGGCVFSNGSVSLQNSVVTSCFLEPGSSTAANSKGGGVYAKGSVTVISSTVSGNVVTAGTGKAGYGAGIYAKTGVAAKYSTISSNSNIPTVSDGGGVFSAGGNMIVFKSTIDGNSANRGAGLFLAAGGTGATISYSTLSNNRAASINGAMELRAVDNTKTATIVNSTISGNTAKNFQGGAGTYFPTRVYNSTIAFNNAASQNFANGVYSSQAITMQSSIFADNGSYDVGSKLTGVLTGSNNLITATTNAVPLTTISSCPKLGPLANNGGGTKTLQLLTGSPAIDMGNLNGGALTTDQRNATRNVGGGVDIGSYERQASETDDRVFVSEFEGRCN